MAGPSGAATSAAAGLPFAGIPSELAERAQVILDQEPEHPDPEISFSQVVLDRRPFTLRTFLAGHRRAMAIAFALVVVETLALQVGPLLTERGIDDGIAKGNRSVLVAVGLVYLASILITSVATWLRISFTGRLGEGLTYDLRIRVFSHFQRLSLEYFTEEKAGRLLTRMTSDIEALTQLFQDGLVNLAVQGLTLLIITGALFWLDPILALVTLLGVVPIMLGATLWFRSASDRGYAMVRERIAEVLTDLSENLAGIRILTAHNRRRHNVVAHRNVVGEHRDANLYVGRVGSIYGPGTDAIGILGQALIVGVGGYQVTQGRLSIGALTAFLLYLTAFFAPIQQLVQLYSTYQSGQAAMTKLRDLLSTEPSVAEAPDAQVLPAIEGAISFEDVAFAYGDNPLVVEHVDLEIVPGETVAFVGPTGAGKSTLARLVARFADPTRGRVCIDGHDLRDVTFHSLRSQLGIVPQEPFLFHGTVRDNVAFARPDAPEEEVLAACDAVGLRDLLDRLPDGIEAPVHERGSSLSSGERQLMALARAFLARPRVLILDEATSSLDLRSEAQVEQALDVVLEGRTAIVIAHRLATAMRADRIVVVADGGIAEVGSHDELVAAGGRYAAMHDVWERHGTDPSQVVVAETSGE
jgi:ATP-binding cassette subfamily B protein